MPDLVDWTTGPKNANAFIKAAIIKTKSDVVVSNKITKMKSKLKEILVHLFNVFNKNGVISVHQVATPNIDTILTLFIRVNSGGLVCQGLTCFFQQLLQNGKMQKN